jgi:hypothetical protein
MQSHRIAPRPTGACFCGCGAETRKDSFFLAGHDKKAESMLTKIKYGEDDSVAYRLVDEGYGPDGKNLLEEYTAQQKALAADRMEYSALVSLNEMASKPGIVEAVVFTAPVGVPWEPTKTPAGDPQPAKTSSLQVPFRGTVVAQGFTRVLTDKEKEIVQARFKGRSWMWITTS